MIQFIFAFLFCSAFAQEKLPVISPDFFKLGSAWTWRYFAEGEGLYSVEKYEVIANDGREVTLEMSTHFPGQGTFQAHHRIQVDVRRCLKAYRNPVDIQPWSFRMFHRQQNRWIEVIPPTTLAFEEKFNCNPHRYDSLEFLTVFKNSSSGELFMHKRFRVREGTWFHQTGPYAAVLNEKAFNHGSGTENYVMRFHSGSHDQHPYISVTY